MYLRTVLVARVISLRVLLLFLLIPKPQTLTYTCIHGIARRAALANVRANAALNHVTRFFQFVAP